MDAAWKAALREMPQYDGTETRPHAEVKNTKILSDSKSSYPVRVGLYDDLTDYGGNILPVSRNGAGKPATFYKAGKGIDIKPPARRTKPFLTVVQKGWFSQTKSSWKT